MGYNWQQIKMKKTLCILIALLSIAVASRAQVCKISESNDNVEVQYVTYNSKNNHVLVTVGNDSQNISANVTVTVEVKYRAKTGNTSQKTMTLSGRKTAQPNGETLIDISCNLDPESYKIEEVKCTNISGTKCM